MSKQTFFEVLLRVSLRYPNGWLRARSFVPVKA